MSKKEMMNNKENENNDLSNDRLNISVKKLLSRGKNKGFLTYDDINKILPKDQLSTDQIEQVMSTISDAGINISENEFDEESENFDGENFEAEDDDEFAEEGAAGLEDLGRTDDPVRMYLRDMGGVELLSREGEIVIAKRIEASRDQVIRSLCNTPIALRQFINWHEDLINEKIYLREILDLESIYGSNFDESFAEDANAGDILSEKSTLAKKDDLAAKIDAPEIEEEIEDDADDESSSASIANMEASLLPSVLEAFNQITQIAEKMLKMHKNQLTLSKNNKEISKQDFKQENRFINC